MATPVSTINSLKVLNPSSISSKAPLAPTLEKTGGVNNNYFNTSKSFAVFNDILQKSYQKMVFNPEKLAETPTNSVVKTDISDYESVEKISSQQAANTILNFIKQRLTLDKIEGADEQALTERLEQGQQGFVKGFNEAKQIIDDLGLLTPELLQEIDDTYRLVTEGLTKLKEDIIGT
jgi:hypothetical protein